MTKSAQDSATHKAIWIPSWYELDQPLRVNEVGRFVFFQSTPDWITGVPPELATDFDFVFFNQLVGDTPWEAHTARVVAIDHPTLGSISSVDTYGLDYVFQGENGQQWVVNAEEDPGVCADADGEVDNWGLRVWLADVSSRLPRNDDIAPGQGHTL